MNYPDQIPRPVVTLITDFGTSDHYAGVMKGVILGIAPAAQVVDITHEITPYAIGEAAFAVSQTYPYFPNGTVHVVVIDPGVGTARRPILVKAANQYFIGPDNGVFAMVWAREECSVRVISNSDLFRDSVSQTFHGRDIFAPVAAHIAAGIDPDSVGEEIEDYLKPTGLTPVRTGKRIWTGAILKVDHFGNIVTNFHRDEVPDLSLRTFEMQVGFHKVDQMARTYAEAPDDVFAIVGSSGFIEVSARQKSAAKLLGVAAGAPVELTLY